MVVVIFVGAFVTFIARREHPESDEDKRAKKKTELVNRLVRLNELHCRRACLWLAEEGSLAHQETLLAALKATSPIQGDGDEEET